MDVAAGFNLHASHLPSTKPIQLFKSTSIAITSRSLAADPYESCRPCGDISVSPASGKLGRHQSIPAIFEMLPWMLHALKKQTTTLRIVVYATTTYQQNGYVPVCDGDHTFGNLKSTYSGGLSLF
jgi:hypothetical protein